jgi:uncharacterized membrane protein
MKKAIASPLCSGLVIPGLGQIMNQDLKKGGLLLGGVFVLFIAGIIKLVHLIHSIFRSGSMDNLTSEMIMARLGEQNLTLLWAMAALFVLLWLYAVVDAYVEGRRIDKKEEESREP